MQNIMVVGGAGFIGSHLVDRLSQTDYKVSVLVREKSDTRFIRGLKKVELRLGDILNPDSLKKALEGIDTIFCSVNVKPRGLRLWEYHNALQLVHVQGTKNLIEACKFNKIKRFFYLGSMAAFLYKNNIYTINQFSVRDLRNTYGRVKLEAENLLLTIPAEELGVTIFRPPEVFGERGPGALGRYILFVKKGILPVFGSIKNTHNIAYAGNIADQIIFLARQESSKGKQYIISDEKPYMIGEIIESVCRAMNTRPLKVCLPKWLLSFGCLAPEKYASVINEYIHNDYGILQKLGYKQEYNLETAVTRTVNWYKER